MNTDKVLLNLIKNFAKEVMEFSDRDDLVQLCDITLIECTDENMEIVFNELAEYRWIYDAWIEHIQELGLLKQP